MLGRIIKRERLIVVRSAFRDGSGTHQRNAHDLMPNHERDNRPLLLGQRQKLRSKLAHHIAIERYVTRDPEAVEH
jgi:hypothetical protein